MTDPVAATSMLIRRPVAEVFRAIADPTLTTRFWFTDATGALAPGARVTWTWAMYGVSTEVEVHDFKPERRILMTWDNPSDPTEVEWRFEPRGDHTPAVGREPGFQRLARGAGQQGARFDRRLRAGAGRREDLAGARDRAWLRGRPPSGRAGGGMEGRRNSWEMKR